MKPERRIRRRLGRDLILQALLISLAVIVGVFVATRLVEDVLIEQALEGEAEHYWQRDEKSPGAALPDTLNLTAYREGMDNGIPDELRDLQPGFHPSGEPENTLTFVSERGGERLYLVFEAGQVAELVTLFGVLPLALALIVIYLSLYLAYRTSRRAVSPIERLARQVQHLDPGDTDSQPLEWISPDEPDDEIRVLAEALQDLVGRVADFAERERRFTRDASHELRTPLTVIKIAVDRLLRDHRLDEGSEQTLLRIRNSTEDMQQLTSAFLLMARESDVGMPTDWICLNDVAAAELERALIVSPNSEISTRIEADARLEVLAPEKVLESVVGNLLRNALAYTDAGQVTISISEGSVTIEDTGPGMAAGEIEKVFQPFYRKERRRGGFGVGLTIVKRLSDRFAWPIEMTSEVGHGTRVTVKFPGSRSKAL
jgi:signal transduction histidine kinase